MYKRTHWDIFGWRETRVRKASLKVNLILTVGICVPRQLQMEEQSLTEAWYFVVAVDEGKARFLLVEISNVDGKRTNVKRQATNVAPHV